MSKFVEVDVDRVIAKTELAFLIEVEGVEFWVPVSQLETVNVDALDEAHAEQTSLVDVQIPAWLAEKEGVA